MAAPEPSAQPSASAQPAAQPGAPEGDAAAGRVARAADGIIDFIARHWLAIFNTLFGLYVLLPVLAPVLMQLGLEAAARPIYALYSFFCHQIPDHSYFLFGPTLVPSQEQLLAAGMEATPNLFIERRFVGNELVGYKVALCQRDVAIYGAIFLGGLLFALLRRRIKPLPVKWLLLAMLPIALDGGTQLLGLRESTWWLRTLTGALFGLAGLLWIYPYVDAAMRDVLEDQAARPASGAPPGAAPPHAPQG